MIRATLSLLLGLGLLLALAALARWADRPLDLSAGQRLSLNPQSLAVLERLEGPVEVISYVRDHDLIRPMVAEFVGRYRRHKPDLELRFVNPDHDPQATRELDLRVEGELEIRWRGRSERLTMLQEQAFTRALARMSRAAERIIVVLDGHGERSIERDGNADLSSFAAHLDAQGLRVIALNPLEQPRIPRNTGLLVIASPRVPLGEIALGAVLDFVDAGGALLWLTEPGSSDGLDALAERLGLTRLPGTLVDGASQRFGIGDPSFVPVTRYGEHPVVAGFGLVTLFPRPVALAVRGDLGWSAASLLSSGPQSWTETGPLEGRIAFDAEAGELAGPLDLGIALVREHHGREQRVVVIGDGDFLSNSFLGNGGNRELGLRLFNWLVGDDDHIEIPPLAAADARLDLTARTLAVIGIGWLIVLPLLMLLAGVSWSWWRRRA